MFYRTTLALAAAAAAVGLAACGDGGGGSESSTKSGAGASIKVMVVGPLQAEGFSLPTIPLGARAAADEINAAGGVDGRKIEVIACNDKNDPNEAVKCASRAAADGVTALVGGFSNAQAQMMPVLAKAKIPWVGGSAVADFTSKELYIIGGDAPSLFFGMAKDLSESGCKKIVPVVEDFDAPRQGEKLTALGVATAGGNYGKPVYAPQNASDWSPAIASAIKQGADCLALLVTPAVAPRIIAAAAKSGKKLTIGAAENSVPAQVLAAVGKAADNVRLATSYWPESAAGQHPGVAKLQTAVDTFKAGTPLDAFINGAYASVKAVAEAAEGRKNLAGGGMQVALKTVSGFDTGVGPVVDFSKPNPAPAFASVYNRQVIILGVKSGKTSLARDEPLDVTPAFQAAAAAR